jgi:hypothetical protein
VSNFGLCVDFFWEVKGDNCVIPSFAYAMVGDIDRSGLFHRFVAYNFIIIK